MSVETNYQKYVRLRRECGYEDDHGIVEKVWLGCSEEAQQNMIAQMQEGANSVAAEKLARGPDWGTWG